MMSADMEKLLNHTADSWESSAVVCTWLTRLRGTPLTLKGPVTNSRPESSCFRKTHRFPLNLPANKISTVPG